jgi:hypothetical protein
MSDALIQVVDDLTDRGFILCAVVTDNAANEIATVRLLAEKIQRPIVRIPCLSHTLNLAVEDFFTAVFGKGVFIADLRDLSASLPTASEGDAFYGLESICPTRWLCFGGFVRTIVRKHDIAMSLVDPGSTAGRVLRKDNFLELDECFGVVNSFMTSTESRKSFLDGFWSAALQALRDLAGLHGRRNMYAQTFARAVRDRLARTADLGQLVLGFLVTEPGLAWYRGLRPAGESAGGFSQSSVLSLVDTFLRHFVQIFEANPEWFFRAFDVYLNRIDWPAGRAPLSFWQDVWKTNTRRYTYEDASYKWVASMAFILMRMPCSEAEVERLFSRMRLITGKRSRRIKRDLLEARLTLQVNSPMMAPEVWGALQKLEEEEDGAPVGMQMLPGDATPTAGPAGREFPIPVIAGN